MTPAPLHLHHFGPADGPPVVLLHSLTGHGRRWRPFAGGQLPGFRVHAPDLRGHGLSPTAPPWTLEDHARDVLASLDRSGLRRVPVVGHSLGATVAVYLARLAPDRVERLVLLDPGIGLPPHVAEHQATVRLQPPVFDTPQDAARERARSWPAQAEPLVAGEVADHLARSPDGRWRWRYSTPAVVTAYSELARPAVPPPAHTPTLLVLARTGRKDHYAYADRCRAALGDRLTLAELDSGHQVYLERPAETGALTRDFLALG